MEYRITFGHFLEWPEGLTLPFCFARMLPVARRCSCGTCVWEVCFCACRLWSSPFRGKGFSATRSIPFPPMCVTYLSLYNGRTRVILIIWEDSHTLVSIQGQAGGREATANWMQVSLAPTDDYDDDGFECYMYRCPNKPKPKPQTLHCIQTKGSMQVYSMYLGPNGFPR